LTEAKLLWRMVIILAHGRWKHHKLNTYGKK
jgi:hypothetical protein